MKAIYIVARLQKEIPQIFLNSLFMFCCVYLKDINGVTVLETQISKGWWQSTRCLIGPC